MKPTELAYEPSPDSNRIIIFKVVARIALALILVISAGLKFASPEDAGSGFHEVVALLPRSIAGSALWAIGLTELVAGWTLLLRPRGIAYRLALLSSLLLGGAFVSGTVIRLAMGLGSDCGCFGVLSTSLPSIASLAVAAVISLLAFTSLLQFGDRAQAVLAVAIVTFSVGASLSAGFIYLGNAIPIRTALIEQVQTNAHWPGFKASQIGGKTPARYLSEAGYIDEGLVLKDSDAFYSRIRTAIGDSISIEGYVSVYTIPYKYDRLGFIRILTYYDETLTLRFIAMEDLSVGLSKPHAWDEPFRALSSEIVGEEPQPYVTFDYSTVDGFHPLARQIIQSLNTAAQVLLLETGGGIE